MKFKERLKGSLVCGAIGDAVGFRYEVSQSVETVDFDFDWQLSDDTQLTLATCEAIYDCPPNPEKIAASFLNWYNHGRLRGLGSSTLKALRDLQLGAHWALSGRSGEYAAGNGAAMRIAPLAFKKNVDKVTIKDICCITHKNDEAYMGALAVYEAIRLSLEGKWQGEKDLLPQVCEKLSDTKLKDRMIQFIQLSDCSIFEIAKLYPSSGYVVDSVPLAIFAAQKMNETDFETILEELIQIGGDTDTVCSIFGQIVGSLKGTEIISTTMMRRFNQLKEKEIIENVVEYWQE